MSYFREADKARREEYRQELEEIQGRVEKRPLLFERQSQLNAKRCAERKYEDILRTAGVDEQLVRSLVTKDGKIIDAESENELSDSDTDYYTTGSSSKDPRESRKDDDSENEEDIEYDS